MQKQIIEYTNQYLFPWLYGYRKGFSAQTGLFYFIKKWKLVLDKKGYVVAKLNVYGFSKRNTEINF